MHEKVFSELDDPRKGFRTFFAAVDGAADVRLLEMFHEISLRRVSSITEFAFKRFLKKIKLEKKMQV